MEYAVPALLFVLGACVGSFLNVVILRFGFSERSARRSECAQCAAKLVASDLIPIVSYLALRGRCRRCGSRVSLQYPFVEVCAGALFVLSYVSDPTPYTFFAAAGFWVVLLGLVVYDIRHTLVPLPFVYALFGFALVRVIGDSVTFGSTAPLLDALLGAVLCGGFFALISAITRGRGMGIGDAYIAAAIGAMFGLQAGVVSGVFAVWIGALLGVVLLLTQAAFKQLNLTFGSKHVTLKTEIPFAPFLALGALVTYVTGYAPVLLGAIGLSL